MLNTPIHRNSIVCLKTDGADNYYHRECVPRIGLIIIPRGEFNRLKTKNPVMICRKCKKEIL